ncbi:MAG: hypothetical protein DIU80_010620 [Chloroflexota bacterium]|mgnify:CR=1 FL=1|nr:MAG: hypothetical protein DIU80_18010 [Chloroflexota bacterium]
MTSKLFTLLDRVQDGWPSGAGLLVIVPAAQAWSIDAAYRVVSGWSHQEFATYSRQLRELAESLAALHRKWCVAAILATILGALIVVAGMPVATTSDQALAILVSVLAAVLLPPLVICNGIARDCVAAQSLLIACSQSTARTF